MNSADGAFERRLSREAQLLNRRGSQETSRVNANGLQRIGEQRLGQTQPRLDRKTFEGLQRAESDERTRIVQRAVECIERGTVGGRTQLGKRRRACNA